MIIAIDPGTEQSAVVVYDGGKIPYSEIKENRFVKDLLGSHPDKDTHLAIEMVACYGMPVGKTVFETCVWIGRFVEAWQGKYEYVYRKDVKMYLCNSTRAKDSNIRQALIDKFGGCKEFAIGKKKTPGPLYGFKKDLWAALGVAVTYDATH